MRTHLPSSIEEILEKALDGVDPEAPDAPEKIAAVMPQVYAELTKEMRIFLPSVQAVASLAGKDLGVVAATFMSLINEIGKNDDLVAEATDFAKTRARNRKIALDAYVEAGFERGEAFALVSRESDVLMASLQAGLKAASASREY